MDCGRVSDGATTRHQQGSQRSRADERRERILTAASRLFAEQGFHNTGIAQIARESDVLMGQLYRDFASKQDIIVAIVERDMQDFLPDVELTTALDANDHPAIRRWITRFISCPPEEGETDHRVISEIIAEAARSDRVAGVVTRIHQSFRSQLSSALERLAPGDARARRREMLVEVILTISSGVFQRRVTFRDALPDEVIAVLAEGVQRRIDMLAAS